MNLGALICSILASLFLLFAIIFTIRKEKAAILISGFHSLSKEERKLYDQARMSKDQRNSFLLWDAIFGSGIILSQLISQYMAIPVFMLWLFVFFKDVHFDEERAFGKYKRK